jgi:hypothetical protein
MASTDEGPAPGRGRLGRVLGLVSLAVGPTALAILGVTFGWFEPLTGTVYRPIEVSRIVEDAEDAGDRRGWASGFIAGEEDGYKKGYEKGYNAGFKRAVERGERQSTPEGASEGAAKGFEDGLDAGRADGYDKGYEEAYECAASATGADPFLCGPADL